MKAYMIQSKIQSIIHNKHLHWIFFKEFTVPEDNMLGKKWNYSAVRYKWLATILRIITGCKHRDWITAMRQMLEHNTIVWMEKEFNVQWHDEKERIYIQKGRQRIYF